MFDEARCRNCGHRASLHWTLTFRCRHADDCLCVGWPVAPPMVWPAATPRPIRPEPGPDAFTWRADYDELIESVKDLTR